MDTDNLNTLLVEIAYLKKGRALLGEIWNWYGPYGPEKCTETKKKGKGTGYDSWVEAMPADLQQKLQYYFAFDDGE